MDHLLVFLFAVVLPYNGWRNYPKFLQALAINPSQTRLALYAGNIVVFTVITVLTLLWWWFQDRSMSELGISWPADSSFHIGFALVGLLFFVSPLIYRYIAKCVERNPALQRKLTAVPDILPRSDKELKLFMLVSLVAGVGEEILYRGFLIWYLQQYMGLFAALLVSSLIFGIAHAYQGIKGVYVVAPLGFLLALLYIYSGSLWPVMLLHAAIDVFAGYYGRYILKD